MRLGELVAGIGTVLGQDGQDPHAVGGRDDGDPHVDGGRDGGSGGASEAGRTGGDAGRDGAGVDAEISAIGYDSRKATAGTLFVCLPGERADGHQFIDQCYDAGVRAFVVERPEAAGGHPDATFVLVDNARRALALLSARFFGEPARRVAMIGVTGTKGKTSVAFLIQSILQASGRNTAVIGTTGVSYRGVSQPTANTTPESHELHRLIAGFEDCQAVVMEVSSQGIMQHRTDGIEFDVGVFLNLSEDHIGPGEHASFEEYAHYKSLLFAQCRDAVIDTDSPHAPRMIEQYLAARPDAARGLPGAAADGDADSDADGAGGAGRLITVGLTAGDITAGDIAPERQGSSLGVGFTCSALPGRHLRVAMPGAFSVSNALAAIGVARLVGADDDAIAAGLAAASVVGRAEPVEVPADFAVIVDYAHNEVSMSSLLTALRAYSPRRVICVFGAGGNRATSRRLEVGRVAGELADLSILTADNPRDEDVNHIIDEIVEGIAPTGGAYERVPDRTAAIHRALELAGPGDIVAIAGKGHQTYEEVRGVRRHLDDREAVRSFFAGR